ncbi:general negative regulator of transcription subunit 5 [Tilletia horrida]|uniref:General negative regulator of transcription subunit n=1 Tax=Tilletia horrida TaxID=155126 RepID=A0AAN6GJ40_9BASI|nr:general negative regulator of transcription subunit 5 [Tilletia horrida]KAK0560749.1 general negative regulator of transcription subunit 5 [Tilletia horrida]
MAARKLQTEIDRTLKKVAEGVESFEGLYDKLQQSTNQTQKEKLEADLKTQIKKLQRMRDQIKTWLQSNDIKDKKPLLDNRKLIETQMERFKACEKEMKTKAFSKEGLSAAQRINPEEQAKVDMSNWISTQVDELSHQIEAAEAQLETIAAGGKKKKHGGSKDERASELELSNERRQWHINKLEILMRLLQNGNLDPEQVEGIKDDILYFVESNADEGFEEDEGIYDEFNLDEEEEAFGLKDNDDMTSSHDGASAAGDPVTRTPVKEPIRQRHESEEAVKTVKDDAIPTGPKKTARKPSTDAATAAAAAAAAAAAVKEKTVPPANFNQQAKPAAAASASSASAPKPTPAPAPLPPIRYAAAAAAAVASTAPSTSPATTTVAPASTVPQSVSPATSFAQSVSAGSQAQSTIDTSVAAPSNPPSAAGTPAMESAKVQPLSSTTPTASGADGSAATPSTATNGPPGFSSIPPPPSSFATGAGANGAVSESTQAQRSPVQQQANALPLASQANGVPAQQPQQQAGPPGVLPPPPGVLPDGTSQLQQQGQGQVPPTPQQQAAMSQQQQQAAGAGGAQQGSKQQEARLPSSLSDLVSSFESAKQKSLRQDANLGQVHKSLESSFLNVPDPLDSDKPKYYVPKNPFPTPSYYPQTPAPIFDNPALYSKFDVDTLFYIFYYQQGTYHQYLAARELKKQSWRFHKQYLTWFQRHSEPQAITDEYEQGVYVYFDWEGSWCQRKKSDFRFEYRWLEDN